jgi:hypothetical protein
LIDAQEQAPRTDRGAKSGRTLLVLVEKECHATFQHRIMFFALLVMLPAHPAVSRLDLAPIVNLNQFQALSSQPGGSTHECHQRNAPTVEHPALAPAQERSIDRPVAAPPGDDRLCAAAQQLGESVSRKSGASVAWFGKRHSAKPTENARQTLGVSRVERLTQDLFQPPAEGCAGDGELGAGVALDGGVPRCLHRR